MARLQGAILLHPRFFQAAGLCAATALVLILGAGPEGVSTLALVVSLAATAGLLACGQWYRSHPQRAADEAAAGHAALAVPGAVVTAFGAFALDAGVDPAPPMLAVGVAAIAVSLVVLVRRACHAPPRVRRLVSDETGADGSAVLRIDYLLDN